MIDEGRLKQGHFQEWVNLLLAALLFMSPWLLGFTGESQAAWDSWIGGTVIAALAIIVLVQPAEWTEWCQVAVGAWLVVAPWALGFGPASGAIWSTIVLGVLIAVVAAWQALAEDHESTHAIS